MSLLSHDYISTTDTVLVCDHLRARDLGGSTQLTAGLALGPNADSVTSHCHGLRHQDHPPVSLCHMLSRRQAARACRVILRPCRAWRRAMPGPQGLKSSTCDVTGEAAGGGGDGHGVGNRHLLSSSHEIRRIYKQLQLFAKHRKNCECSPGHSQTVSH